MEQLEVRNEEPRMSVGKRLFDSLGKEMGLEVSRVQLDCISPDEFIKRAEKIIVSMKALQITGPEEWIRLYTKGLLDEVIQKNLGPMEMEVERRPVRNKN